jgi:2-polyprenyl-6-methoxyphenol hydroxylase-like FAD-dependent oxidoreductase
MAKPLNVLISGTGIAGSVFAWWLLRAQPKCNITFVERAPALRISGSSIDIRSSAVDIIKRMGLEPEIRAHGTGEQGLEFLDEKGRSLGTMGASGRTDVQSFSSEYEIHRGELARIFITPILDKVKMIFSDSVASYKENKDGVEVTFTKSRKKERYDLLVAADGFGSKVRGMLLDSNPDEQLYDEGVHVGYFTAKKDFLNGSRVAQAINAPGGRCIMIRPDPNPAGRTKVLMMNITWKNNTEIKARLNKAISEGNDAYMALIEEMFGDMGWLAPEILKCMRQSDDFYCSLFGQVRSPRLHSGNRVVLLGDAGFATPGIGTSLAIMGAYVLAGELTRNQENLTKGLKAYEELMLPFVKTQQGSDIAMQLLNPQSAWGLAVRNSLLRVVTTLKLDQLAMYASAWIGWTEKKPELPDFVWPDI